MNGLCRCCLSEGEFRSLDAAYKRDGNYSYSELLRETFNIIMSPMPGLDNASTYTICNRCTSQLRDAAQFRNQVLECEKKFAAFVENYLGEDEEIEHILSIVKEEVETDNAMAMGPGEGNDYVNEIESETEAEKSESSRQNELKQPCGVKRRNINSVEEAEEQIDIDIDVPPKRAYEPQNQCKAKSFNVIAEKICKNTKEARSSYQSPPVENGVPSEPTLRTPSPTETVQEPSSGRPKPVVIGRPPPAPVEESHEEPLISASIEGATGKVTKNFPVPEDGYLVIDIHPDNNDIPQQTGAICANDIETVVHKELIEMKADIRKICENQYQLSKYQNTVMEKLSELSTKFDELVKFSPLKTQKTENEDNNIVKPISNITELDEFQKKLEVRDAKDQLFRKLSLVCRKGPGTGITNAYSLIDTLFDRKFIKQCSWTGLSKSDTSKYCFKALTKVTDFFFEIVHQSDETFTKIDCNKFFKTVLRNAEQRCRSQVRMSSHRRKLESGTKKGAPTSLTEQQHKNPSIEIEFEYSIEGKSSNPGRDEESLPDENMDPDV